MLPIGHIGAGIVWGHWAASRVRHVSAAQAVRLGALGGLLPDVDLPLGMVWYWWRDRRVEIRHHQWPTHTPFFHLVWIALAYGRARRQGDRAMQERLMVVGGATLLHLLQDLVGTGDGVQMFYPLSRRQIGIGLFGCHGRDWVRAYVRHPLFLCEIACALAGFWGWWRRRHSQKNRYGFGILTNFCMIPGRAFDE